MPHSAEWAVGVGDEAPSAACLSAFTFALQFHTSLQKTLKGLARVRSRSDPSPLLSSLTLVVYCVSHHIFTFLKKILYVLDRSHWL